jgi:hypothetical protein
MLILIVGYRANEFMALKDLWNTSYKHNQIGQPSRIGLNPYQPKGNIIVFVLLYI